MRLMEGVNEAAGNDLLAAALAYAGRGWPVFPCHTFDAESHCSCGQTDCSSPAKHPRTEHGFKDASSDEDVIRQWWRRWPDASVALATGAAGLVVIDIDVKHGVDGEAAWQRLVGELGGKLEETASARTPSVGRHLYFVRPSGLAIASSAGKLAPGVDVRAEGGYVIAPPSVGAGGVPYEWLPRRGLGELRELPVGLAERLMTSSHPHEPALSAATGAIAHGQRNTILASHGGRLRADGLDAEAIADLLLAENTRHCQPPLPETEVRAIAASVGRYPTRSSGPALIKGSDSDNAERFITRFGEQVRYCALEKCWYRYDGRRWAPDDRLAIEDMMRRTLLSHFEEAARSGDDPAALRSGRLGVHLQSAKARRAALECARSDARLALRPGELDRDPELLNCRNGTLDLRDGSLRPHNPADLISRLAPVDYDAGARLPLWERFLAHACGGDIDFLRYLQRLAGCTLSGDTGERIMLLLLGPTSTCKSTFIESFQSTLGDYAYPAGMATFLRRSHPGGPRPDIVVLAGRRLVTGIEVDKREQLDEVLVKQFVGGDTVSERDLYRGLTPFLPQATLWLAANDPPRMSDGDDALWTRLRVLPFRVQIPREAQDASVKATLRDPEKAGAAILAWAVEGCLAWRRQGLGSCAAERAATRELRLSLDPLTEFLDECTEPAADGFVSNEVLRAAYRSWLGAANLDRIGAKEWGQRLRRRGLPADKERGQRGYRGLRLI